jgi:predicted PurR-regulated permease PerM
MSIKIQTAPSTWLLSMKFQDTASDYPLQIQSKSSILQDNSIQAIYQRNQVETLDKLLHFALGLAKKAIKEALSFINNIMGVFLGFFTLSLGAFFFGKYVLTKLSNHLKTKVEIWKDEFFKRAFNNFSDWFQVQHPKLQAIINQFNEKPLDTLLNRRKHLESIN